MRFRTKLLLTGGGVAVLLWLGTLGAVRYAIEDNSNHLAALGFDGTRKSLDTLRAERATRMRQAGSLVMSIPELRALIAEHNYEVSADNVNSLQERLDSLKGTVGVSFICVLDAHGALIAQNHGSPWNDLAVLNGYLSQSRQARSLVKGLFSPGADTGSVQGRYALWEYQGRIYEVMGQALVFNVADGSSAAPPADGAMIMASPLTDALASDLGASHNCQVSFLAEGQLAASSLPAGARTELVARWTAGLPQGQAIDLRLAGVNYRSFLEDLRDPCSGESVGCMLIQASRADAEAASRHVSNRLMLIMATSLGLAAWVSLPLSAAVTRPVQELVRSVRRVAGGDLDFVLPAARGDELGELARAFNDMVSQLRARQELQRLVETSQAASKAKSQFLANMSHEIRTPLNGVIGVAELLLRTELSARQRRYAGLVKSSAEVLTTLINDILDFSKIEAGKLEIESIEFNLHAVAQDIVEMMALKASAKGLEMVCCIDPEVPAAVRGDPNRLRQIVMNLISNAVKFTEAGRVALRVTHEDAADGRHGVRFAVTDTGIGIPAERMDRLFKSFSQVDASTTRRFGGTGLGLAICKQLVELMGGRIGVESKPGEGSTFWFTIEVAAGTEVSSVDSGGAQSLPAPVISGNGSHPALPPAAPARTVHPFRILLAEDNEVNQVVAADLLAEAGYACDIATDGQQAVEAAMSGSYALVLMDCQMPIMDGFEAAREIRRREQEQAVSEKNTPRCRLPIIALTANAAGGDRERCIEAGMDDYCGKPFDPRQFLSKVVSLLPAHVAPAVTGERGGGGSRLAASQIDGAPRPAMGDRESPIREAASGDPGASDETSKPPIDMEALLRRCSGKTALARVVLEKFEKQAAENYARLEACERTGDAEQLARSAHALKGTAGIVAADALRQLSIRLEEVGLAGDFALVRETLAGVRDEIRRCAEYAAGARASSCFEKEPSDARADS